MEERKYQTVYSIIGLIAPLIFFVYLSVKGQTYGVDSWYHITKVFQTPLAANAYAYFTYILIFGLFLIIPKRKHNALFIGSLFMLNIWHHRFLEPEVTDYIFIYPSLISISVAAILHDRIPEKIRPYFNYKTIALAGVMGYMILRGWMPLHPYLITDPHPENIVQFSVLFGLLPIISLLAWNRRWPDLAIVTGLFLMWPSAKFVLSALYFYGFAVHIDLMRRSDFRYPKHLVTALMIFFVSYISILAYQTPLENQQMFEDHCDPETFTCSGLDPDEYHYGHYFAHLGYRTDNPLEFGVCECQGTQCMNGTIICGSAENKRTFIFGQPD